MTPSILAVIRLLITLDSARRVTATGAQWSIEMFYLEGI
jgi:hypothetical protein